MPVGDYFLRVSADVSAQNLAFTRERRPLVVAVGIAGGHFSGFHLTWKEQTGGPFFSLPSRLISHQLT